jgi:hypothetical protein
MFADDDAFNGDDLADYAEMAYRADADDRERERLRKVVKPVRKVVAPIRKVVKPSAAADRASTEVLAALRKYLGR